VHSQHGRARLIDELGVDGELVHVIPHGVFTHLAERPPGSPSPRSPFETDKPVVLCFGLMRPYKGIDVLLDAWCGVEGEEPLDDAELWIAGMPKMDITAFLEVVGQAGQGHSQRGALRPQARGVETTRDTRDPHVRFVPRFIGDDELPAYFERADLVVLPYLQADQSGVLFTALAFGKPLLLSDVGGFPEMTSTGAARVVPTGDARALGQALRELLHDRAALTEMCVKARAAADGRYSWESVARAHVELYEQLLGGARRR
jgi:glycosyltransferase involved in cell wall biosynthesis